MLTILVKTILSTHSNTFVTILLLFFTALHGMQTRSSDENSVCLSVKRVDCVTKWKKRSVQMYIPYFGMVCETKPYHTDHLDYSSEKKNGWWEATPST